VSKWAGIALSGKAGAGKNELGRTIGAMLATDGVWSAQVALADAVKEETKRVYGLTKNDPGGRERLVEVGHGMRQVCPDYWIRQLAKSVDSLRPYGLIPILTDLRYLNEYEWARENHWLIARVDATPTDRAVVLSQRGEDRDFAWTDHPSETELDEVEFAVRFWNPHGSLSVLSHYGRQIADLFIGRLEFA